MPLYENSSPENMAFARRVGFLFAARREAAANWLKDQMDLACSRSGEAARTCCLQALRLRPSYLVEAAAPAAITAPSEAAPGGGRAGIS